MRITSPRLSAALVLVVLAAPPARAEEEVRWGLRTPEPGCVAPPVVAAVPVLREPMPLLPPPFLQAMLACPTEGGGAPKPRLRRT